VAGQRHDQPHPIGWQHVPGLGHFGRRRRRMGRLHVRYRSRRSDRQLQQRLVKVVHAVGATSRRWQLLCFLPRGVVGYGCWTQQRDQRSMEPRRRRVQLYNERIGIPRILHQRRVGCSLSVRLHVHAQRRKAVNRLRGRRAILFLGRHGLLGRKDRRVGRVAAHPQQHGNCCPGIGQRFHPTA